MGGAIAVLYNNVISSSSAASTEMGSLKKLKKMNSPLISFYNFSNSRDPFISPLVFMGFLRCHTSELSLINIRLLSKYF